MKHKIALYAVVVVLALSVLACGTSTVTPPPLPPVTDIPIIPAGDLVIVSSENIGRAWVHENSVQIDQVARNASICITAETRALQIEDDNRFSLTNGPYMRRFLDGYYPMRVSMRVLLQAPGLRFDGISPAAQTGFKITSTDQEVAYEALFEGELRTTIRFSRTSK